MSALLFHAGPAGNPSGIYFRMLLIGYFEGIGSQRGIARRCADCLSLRKFLGLVATEEHLYLSPKSLTSFLFTDAMQVSGMALATGVWHCD